MAHDLNSVQLTGRLGHDVEISYTTQGTAKATFSVASNHTWKDADGATQADVEWFKVVAWRGLAEVAGEYLRTGAHVYVAGRLHTRTWTDATSGQERSRVEVVAREFIMLDPKPRDVVIVADDRRVPPEQDADLL